MGLTDIRIRNAKPSGKAFRLTDGDGLHLEVRPTGKRVWRFRYRLAGKPGLFALGRYPDRLPPNEAPEAAGIRRAAGYFTLLEARAERDRCRALVRTGTAPIQERDLNRLVAQQSSDSTFANIAREWMAGKTDWSDSYRSDVSRTLENDLIPELGKMPIRAIQAAHLLAALRKIEARGAPTVAARARFLSSEIWRHATCTLRADSDLAAALRGAIRMPASQNHPALKPPEIPAFLAALERYPGRNETRLALRLMLMLFPRPNELLGAPWSEFNLDAAEWRIAAARMKGREDHVIPLPTQAVEILRALQHITGNRVHVFPHRDKRDDCMTDAALRAALRLIGYGGKLTPHGLRATAATPLSELGYDADLIEKQLAHTERKKEKAAYLRSTFIEARREMLQTWANLLDTWARGDTNIAAFHKRA